MRLVFARWSTMSAAQHPGRSATYAIISAFSRCSLAFFWLPSPRSVVIKQCYGCGGYSEKLGPPWGPQRAVYFTTLNAHQNAVLQSISMISFQIPALPLLNISSWNWRCLKWTHRANFPLLS